MNVPPAGSRLDYARYTVAQWLIRLHNVVHPYTGNPLVRIAMRLLPRDEPVARGHVPPRPLPPCAANGLPAITKYPPMPTVKPAPEDVE